ncbi:hypothetical protein QFC19_007999 [Naganishia cerealis]|uniref:Uncharacterized protein n=1 Tax=Naganishia cerealis TaxID=610337 RepID=A0ACC2V4N1_9TREE|nr:hypothetical protein QFC19_007999 [Naganishia cerealis]
MSSPQSPYHVLRRLLSICYNSPLETSSFYANILHDLFAEDLLKGIELGVGCLDPSGSSRNGIPCTAKEPAYGKVGTKGKGKSVAASIQEDPEDDGHLLPRAGPEGLTPRDQPISIKKMKVHPHLAIHLRAWIHIGAKEYYSAIHLTRDRVYYDEASKRRGKRKMSNVNRDYDNEIAALVPFDGSRERLQRNHQTCLECAMIVAEACQSLGRYEEGRRILKIAHENTAKANQDPELSITLAKPASFPLPSALLLAQLSAQANHERMSKSSAVARNVESNGEKEEYRQPDAIKYYETALRNDPWLDDNVDLPLLPFPFDLLPEARHLNSKGGLQQFSEAPNTNTRSPSIPSSPPTENNSSTSFTTTTASSASGVRRMSPLPSTSPAKKATLLGLASGALSGMSIRTMAGPSGSYATPVNMPNTETQPGHQYMQERRAARGPPPVQSKVSRGYGRLSPSIDDMSFPDLTFSQSDSALPSTLFSNGSAGERRVPSSTTHPLELPSIASRLFPTARPVSTPPQTGRDLSAAPYEPGIGKPPALKRPRNANMFSDAVGAMAQFETSTTSNKAFEKKNKPRNATGRNASGKALAERFEDPENDKHLRRSTRIRDAHTHPEPNVTPELFHKMPASRFLSGLREQPEASDFAGIDSETAFEQYQQRTADLWLLRIVQRCAAAYHESSNYNCKRAISILNTLPAQLRRGAWATALYAKCHYELADYRNVGGCVWTLSSFPVRLTLYPKRLPDQANTSYEHLRRIEPYRLEGMEWYSTVLWHLEDRTGLSGLAQQLMAVSREAAEPWLAAGNGFALQGDHEEALRCFKRGSAIRPDNAYTYTLAAYEALEMDEYDRAIAHYQLGIRADIRHYHAWFGLGRVYQKMGKTRYAEYHFRRALEINPSNVVLYCCVGTIVEKRGNLGKALEVYEKALEISPDNKMARFRKVRVMIGLKQYKKALPLLEDLSKTCSTEASIMFLLGKLYRLLGDRVKAMRAFTCARDLHPKLASAIASVMATGDVGAGDEEAAAEAIREGL